MTTNRQIEASTTIVGEDGYSYRCTVFLDLGTPFDFTRGSLDIVQCMTAAQLRKRSREARFIHMLYVPAAPNFLSIAAPVMIDRRITESLPDLRYFRK